MFVSDRARKGQIVLSYSLAILAYKDCKEICMECWKKSQTAGVFIEVGRRHVWQ